MSTGIQKLSDFETTEEFSPNAPRWFHRVEVDEKDINRPEFRCPCGKWIGLGDKTIQDDGTVTETVSHDCGFKDDIQLLGYGDGKFDPLVSKGA